MWSRIPCRRDQPVSLQSILRPDLHQSYAILEPELQLEKTNSIADHEPSIINLVVRTAHHSWNFPDVGYVGRRPG